MPQPSRSCLDLVEQHFHDLSDRPTVLDAQLLGEGLPPGRLPLADARVIMLKRQTRRQLKDSAWSFLARMSRRQPEPWAMAAAGMMLPGLKRIAARLGPCYPADRHDLDSEILSAFFHALTTCDPDQQGLSTHLYRAAWRRGREVYARERRQTCCSSNVLDYAGCPRRGSPDLALAQAVRDGAVTRVQASLVYRVHLDCRRRGETARQLGMSRDRARRELTSARRGLSSYLIAA